MTIDNKIERLKDWAEAYTSCSVAFSGGVDSTFLLSALQRYTSLKVHAVTLFPPYVPVWEVAEAKQFAISSGIDHVIIPVDIPDAIRTNPVNRCYLCKSQIFSRIVEQASKEDLDVIADGTNADDDPEERPGMKALSEIGIQSPLRMCGLTKKDIRNLCRKWKLPVAGKPTYSCLLTRLPHNTEVNPYVIIRIEKAERYLHSLGFPAVRVRTSGDGKAAQVDVAPFVLSALSSPETIKLINSRFKGLGYSSVTIGNKDEENRRDT
ncbi:MAG: ATP-dependent sacrificial sulfur transferase LarE [Spirochaetales bacterium]|nr:ATP-dependent sacrificial sulfur transferase LarE [Spirochaetales bacterium]